MREKLGLRRYSGFFDSVQYSLDSFADRAEYPAEPEYTGESFELRIVLISESYEGALE